MGIYAIYLDGNINNIIYVGKSEDILRRISEHHSCIACPKGKEHKYAVMNELEKQGHKLRFRVLYHSASNAPWDLAMQEAYFIQKYKPALNTQYPDINRPSEYEYNDYALSVTAEDIINDFS